jgi:hypothetical protein
MIMVSGGASLLVLVYLIIGVIVALVFRVDGIALTDVVEFALDMLLWPFRISSNVVH